MRKNVGGGGEGKGEGSRRRGVVLLLLSGILALLLILAVLLLQMARASRGNAAARAAQTETFLASASGMEYAAGRLSRWSYPHFSAGPADRPDDWRCLDPWETPLAGLRNPSFPHGEPWGSSVDLSSNLLDDDLDGLVDEPDEGSPVYTSPESWADLDGDGRFGAWSGRLRGGLAPAGLRFSLRIDATEGKIPVNGGRLDAPFCSQVPLYSFHAGLELSLNNLGALTRPTSQAPLGGWARRHDLQAGDYLNGNPGEPIRMSWLGSDLIRSRPAGGYRSLNDRGDPLSVAAVLAPLGYRKEDLDRILPFLDVGPYETPAELERDCDVSAASPYAAVCLAAAPREVLASLWMHLAAGYGGMVAPYLPGKAADWAVPCRLTGDKAKPSTRTFQTIALLIRPEEALRLADAAAGCRLAGTFSWNSLYALLAREAQAIFREDWEDLSGGSPVNRRSWVQMKADLAFQAAALDPFPMKILQSIGRHQFVSSAWGDWGIDRDLAAAGFQGSPGIALQEICGIPFPKYPPNLADPWGMASPYTPYMGNLYKLAPLGLSTAPPVRFRVACWGWSEGWSGSPAMVRGAFRAAERLDFASQEDFESYERGARLAARGIEVRDDPAPQARLDCVGNSPRIASLPAWSRRSGAPADYGNQGYPRHVGALGLGTIESGLACGAKVYFPFSEDFDGDISNNLWSQTAGPPFDSIQAPMYVKGKPIQCSPYGFSTELFGFWVYPSFPSQPPFPQLPGLEGSPAWGNMVRELSVECWMGPSSEWIIRGYTAHGRLCFLSLSTSRAVEDPDLSSTLYTLKIDWYDRIHQCGVQASPVFRIEDREQMLSGDVVGASPGSHVVLSIRKVGSHPGPCTLPTDDCITEFRLYVNGRDHPSGSPMRYLHQFIHPVLSTVGGRLQITADEAIELNGNPLKHFAIDEVRLYDRALTQSDALSLFQAGRYVRKGSFTSPLYVPDAPVRFQAAQWTGITPAGTPNPFSVRLVPYADRKGMAPLGPGISLGAGSGDIRRLDGETETAASFRYLVTLDATGAPGVLNETPIFESIWFTLQRQGTAPAWTRWESH